MSDDLDAALDRLYGLPAEEFTAARDALAKELRGAKRRDEADAVKQRRRPTAPAAAINQLARREPELVEALISAAGDLVGAQERVLGGDAGRDELRAAADAERRAVGALMAAAARLPDQPSAAALEKVRDTLHAAATDDAVRDAIAGGRLEREAEPAGAWGGGFPLGGLPAEPAAARAAPKGATPKGATPKGATPRAPLPSGPLRGGPLRSGPLRRRPLPSGPLRRGPLPSGPQRRPRRNPRRTSSRRPNGLPSDGRASARRRSSARGRRTPTPSASCPKRRARRLRRTSCSRRRPQRAEAARAAVVDAEAAEDEARSEAQRTLRALKRAEAVAADTAEKVGRLDRG